MLHRERSCTSLVKRFASFTVLGLAMPLMFTNPATAQAKKAAPAKAAAPVSHASAPAKPASAGAPAWFNWWPTGFVRHSERPHGVRSGYDAHGERWHTYCHQVWRRGDEESCRQGNGVQGGKRA